MGNNQQKKYDLVFAGAGLAGLSLAYKIRQHKALDQLSILLIDQDSKDRNDRTWCFWTKKDSIFDSIKMHSWSALYFASNDSQKVSKIGPYRYDLIRGKDFYEQVLTFLRQAENTDITTESIQELEENDSAVTIQTDQGSYLGHYLLKSYIDDLEVGDSHFVWQHFKGWWIKADQDTFDTDQATFMDFRVDQGNETRFFYVLPYSPTEALVEIAILGNELPAHHSYYDPYIKQYIKEQMGLEKYQVVEEEVGKIPMTTYDFDQARTHRIIPIGTAAGWVKPSSGYAFTRIQREVDRIVEALLRGDLSKYQFKTDRFHFYDKIFLNAFLTHKTTGQQVFHELLTKLPFQSVFKFLDEEGSFFHDLKIFLGPPKLPFIKAFIEELRK